MKFAAVNYEPWSVLKIDHASVGTRHLFRTGAESIDIVGMPSDPLVVPSIGVTALEQYTSSIFTFTANNITVVLNN